MRSSWDRFLQEAERLRRLALHSPGGEKRSLNQRMADALDTLTSHGSIYAKADDSTREADKATTEGGGTGGGGKCGCAGRPSADITIVQHLNADGTDAFAEIAGGGVIPPSVLEEYFCNARIKGVVFSHEGLPLWHSHAKRLATKAQMSALRARYGACGGCGADRWVCQGHHIRPVSEGGTTDIDNTHPGGALPPESPSPRLAGGARRAGPLHHRTARADPLRPRPRPRPAASPRPPAPAYSEAPRGRLHRPGGT